jgi:ATP adenylyltransferase
MAAPLQLCSPRGVKLMDRLWSPWRYKFITDASREKSSKCIFCLLAQSTEDESNYIVHRAAYNYVVLNIYPYTAGHLLIIPYEHRSELDTLPKPASDEMMDLTKHSQRVLGESYKPDGFNIGINLGKAAGAGVAGHVHLHIMPRWAGDANFMTTIGETRLLNEDLSTTYSKLKGKF